MTTKFKKSKLAGGKEVIKETTGTIRFDNVALTYPAEEVGNQWDFEEDDVDDDSFYSEDDD